ncbi:hypothetical protein [Brevibacillus agri]|nr:hypothetical protein [Brevibacillus agri]
MRQFVGGTLFHCLGAKRLIVGALLVQGLIQLSIPLTIAGLFTSR